MKFTFSPAGVEGGGNDAAGGSAAGGSAAGGSAAGGSVSGGSKRKAEGKRKSGGKRKAKSGLEEGAEAFQKLEECINRKLSERLSEVEDFLSSREELKDSNVPLMRITIHNQVIDSDLFFQSFIR